MKVVFVAMGGNFEPWQSDVLAAVADDRVELTRFDPALAVAPQFEGAAAVVDNGGHGTRQLVDAAHEAGVQLWQVLGTGLDHTEVEYILGKGIRLAHTPGELSAVALAEHALLLMLCIAKRLREAQANLSRGRMNTPVNDELAGCLLGVIGLGASGRELARRAVALGMRVRAVDAVEAPAELVAELGIECFGGPETLIDLLATSDYVSVHVPLSDGTRHLIGAKQLATMKPSAVLVNVARGGIVDERALADALEHGIIAGAGIDVFAQEPPDPANRLLRLETVVATPHVAGVTRGTSRRRAGLCAENLRRLQAGLDPLHEVTGR